MSASLPTSQPYNRLATWRLIASFLGLALILPIAGSIIGIVEVSIVLIIVGVIVLSVANS